MIYIAINVIFNAFILMIVFLVCGGFMHVTPLVSWCLAYIIAGVLALVGYTRIGTSIVSLFMSGRAMVEREKAKLEPLLSDVIDNTNREYGTNYKLSDFKIKVTDDKVVNAFALGYNTITVNRGAFSAFTDEQLRAILAHEMGHLYYRDSVRSIALIFSSFATRIIMFLYAVYAAVASVFANNARTEHGVILSFMSLIPLLIFLPVIILNLIGSKVFELLNRRMSRGAEYRADAFAASLGYKADLIGALEVLDGITAYDNSFVAKFMATHPAPMQRVGALEDEEISRKKIGKLFVAMPFSADNTAHLGGNSEVIRLVTIIIVGGLLWCGLGVYDHILNKPTQITKQSNNLVNKSVPGAKGWVYIYSSQVTKNHTFMVSSELYTNFYLTFQYPRIASNIIC